MAARLGAGEAACGGEGAPYLYAIAARWPRQVKPATDARHRQREVRVGSRFAHSCAASGLVCGTHRGRGPPAVWRARRAVRRAGPVGWPLLLSEQWTLERKPELESRSRSPWTGGFPSRRLWCANGLNGRRSRSGKLFQALNHLVAAPEVIRNCRTNPSQWYSCNG